MTLSEEFCGAEEPPLENRDEYEAWLHQRHPDLRPFELRKEWQHRQCKVWQNWFDTMGSPLIQNIRALYPSLDLPFPPE